MVRRWSYINSINTYYSPGSILKRHSAFGLTIKSTMYYRKPYNFTTTLTRRRWARRKHLYGWLPLSNVLKVWAQTYRFFKNYSKAILRQHFWKSSFLSFNLINLVNSTPSLHKGSEAVVVGSIPKKTMRYFRYISNTRIRTILSFKYVNIAFTSFYQINQFDVTAPDTSYLATFSQDNVSSLTAPTLSPQAAQARSVGLFMNLLQLSFLSTTQFAKFVRRLLTILLIRRI